jgi:diguanylate cyclase
VDDAERRLKEVLYKQSQLKASSPKPRDAIKHMLAGFVDHLADFADATSDYHDKIENCAEKISAAKDISDLGNRARRSHARNTQLSSSTPNARAMNSASRKKKCRNPKHASGTGTRTRRHQRPRPPRPAHRRTQPARAGRNIRQGNGPRQPPRHHPLRCPARHRQLQKLNDSLGHDAGDEALIHLARVCRDTLRPQDTVARYGGEEFIILLPDTSLDDATTALTRLQRELTKKFFLHGNEKVLITFSAGVTQMQPEDTQTTVIKRADEAMYKAKQTGKNRVVTAP